MLVTRVDPASLPAPMSSYSTRSASRPRTVRGYICVVLSESEAVVDSEFSRPSQRRVPEE